MRLTDLQRPARPRDITGQKEAELALQDALGREQESAEALRSMDELKNTLLHTLSHDLKGPLTAILASATTLQRPGLSETEATEVLAGMAQRAKRMDRLLTDLLVTLPGFSSYEDLGASYKMSLSSRGFYASPGVGLPQGISVFLDGVRQNEPDAAQVNFDLLPMEHVTRVEVLSGTGSLLGRNSLGGAINLVTNSGGGLGVKDEAWGARMSCGSSG